MNQQTNYLQEVNKGFTNMNEHLQPKVYHLYDNAWYVNQSGLRTGIAEILY